MSANRKAVMLRGALAKLSRASAAPTLSKVGNGRSLSSIGVNQKLRCLNKSNIYRSNGVMRFSSSESQKGTDKAAPESATNRDDVDKASEESAAKKSGVSIFDRDDFDDYEEPQTAGQKVKPV